MKVDVFNLKREKVGELELSDEVFAAEIKEHLLHEVVVSQLASRRAGTHAAKERSAVTSSKKKAYKQKGTGRARHGQISAPNFVGGGRAHPPRPQDWSHRPPRQVRASALKSALSLLAKEGRLLVLENLTLEQAKTKAFAGVLSTLQASNKALIVDDKQNDNLRLSVRNMESNQFLPPEGVNVYDLLRHDHLVLSKDAAKALEARCIGSKS
ncbi:MAG: 50S ribosomal protein L4 [Polyangiaceae bacterium]|nr:50S ribosomal protein L4 [Polyangiaceae bacterium]MCW5792183.1 50S ribosomal protein L4 [Polyangiaceae bacterium]